MSLLDWRNAGWIRPHNPTPQEIRDMFRIADRDLADAANTGISADSRHYIAYNGALKLCAVLLLAEGYRPEKGQGSHQRAIDSVRVVLGSDHQDTVDYLNLCRGKRNASAYDHVGGVSIRSAEELIEFTRRFRAEVHAWVRNNHSDLATLIDG